MREQAARDRDYVLGTHDEEIARLGLQHRLWRDRVLDGWRAAGFTSGSRIIDVGAGPGFATLDLADVTGPAGSVIAVERSRRFLDTLQSEVRRRDLGHVVMHEADLDEIDRLPADRADGVWCRWVFAFVRQPRQLAKKVLDALAPGGTAVIHEYLDYATWKLIPAVPSFEAFVQTVMSSWREQGGEPDIARALPQWFEDAGSTVVSVRPYVDVVAPADPLWQWPAAFVHSGLDRLVAIGRLDAARAQTMRDDFLVHAAKPGARMVTPLVLELIVRR